jgi:non-heme chloroperoxidase
LKGWFRRTLIWLLLWAMGLAGLVAFGIARPPAPGITAPFATLTEQGLPPLQRYRARDGAMLSYRQYPGTGPEVALLIHGSAGSSRDLHLLARALQGAGATVLVPDLRGHGGNRPHGDIAYEGQLEDDLVDFLGAERVALAGKPWTVLGFSSGGGFALRVAADASLGKSFERFILVSPYLRYDAPSVRQGSSRAQNGAAGATAGQTWAAASVGRIIGLTILNDLGVHAWDGLPVVSFPVPGDIIKSVARPLQVLVGTADEVLDARQLGREFASQRGDVPVILVPGVGHAGMVTSAEGIRAILGAFE